MKSLLISISVFLLLAAAAIFLFFMFLTGMSAEKMIDNMYTEGKLLLFRQGMIDTLTDDEMTQLYRGTCTRKCHSKDVIENRRRTALEWEWVVTRMKAPDRAGISDRHAAAITRYLQQHYLSNVPTVLPEKTMRFVKRHLWKSDFGDSDLYLDIIYIPRAHLSLLPYLVASNTTTPKSGAIFIIYLNTHQGYIPPWDLAEMAKLQTANGEVRDASGWQVIYEDGQHHHKQGILSFPAIDEKQAGTMTVNIHLPGMKERNFQWVLPIARFAGGNDDDEN